MTQVPAGGRVAGVRLPSIAAVLGSGAALVGLVIGLGRLSDNSFFTHLATGRLILEQGSVPSGDPYSFTAPGAAWVVQSWLASVVFALAERIGGPDAIRLLAGLLAAGLAVLAWRLTRPARSLLPRVALTGVVLVLGATFWSPRPLLFGLVLLVGTLVIAEEDRDPRWLVPIFWLWANLHGSFPLGVVALACLAIGAHLDGPEDRRHARIRGVGYAVLGTLIAALSPVGPKLLVFPIELLGRADILQRVVEWQSPKFATGYARLFLLQVVVAVLALTRAPRWRTAVPLVVFTAAALLGLRNIPVASLVLLPGMAVGLRDVGTLRGDERGPGSAVLGAAVVVLAVVVVAGALARPAYDINRTNYPTDAVAWLDDRGLTVGRARIAHSDTTGNYLELLWGPDAAVFLDDRVDMFPVPVLQDYLALNDGSPAWRSVLARHNVDLVLWARGAPLTAALLESDDWKVVYSDHRDVVFCRRGDASAEMPAERVGCRTPWLARPGA